MAENSTLSVRINSDIEEALQSICDHHGCDRADAARKAIKYASENLNSVKPVQTDNTEQLSMLRRIAQQQSEIVALLEPLHVAGGPRKMHARIVHVLAAINEHMTVDQHAASTAVAAEVLGRFGLTDEGQNKA
ncbi:MAG: hypothetical protein A2X82_09060 [Geobacteraceae bacterium GWC2_55_20]|nr:MAG: hypothetical protein A2X82_09060 [Geobacteraceae bacterium GWC2_55_20]